MEFLSILHVQTAPTPFRWMLLVSNNLSYIKPELDRGLGFDFGRSALVGSYFNSLIIHFLGLWGLFRVLKVLILIT